MAIVSRLVFFFFKQKTAYEMRISDWSSDVCSSDLLRLTLTNRRISAPNTAYPRYIGGERNAPPEDCGGVPGFHQLLDAMSDPGHPDHADMHEWVGDYDPAFVDDAAIRAGLAVMASLSADVSHPLARARRAHRSSPLYVNLNPIF